MNKHNLYIFFLCLLSAFFISESSVFAQHKNDSLHEAPAPLYNDPIYDGAADPVLIWNREEKSWWMFYTTRRANIPTAMVIKCTTTFY